MKDSKNFSEHAKTQNKDGKKNIILNQNEKNFPLKNEKITQKTATYTDYTKVTDSSTESKPIKKVLTELNQLTKENIKVKQKTFVNSLKTQPIDFSIKKRKTKYYKKTISKIRQIFQSTLFKKWNKREKYSRKLNAIFKKSYFSWF